MEILKITDSNLQLFPHRISHNKNNTEQTSMQ